MDQSYDKTEGIIIGVDLGQLHDYTAITGIEIVQEYELEQEPIGQGASMTMGRYSKNKDARYHVRHLERLRLNTPYDKQVERVQEIFKNIEDSEGKRPALVIDSTGVGKPVFDMFKAAGLPPIGISIHSGAKTTLENSIYHVPKRDLVGVLQVLYANQRIKISGLLKEREQLNKELLNFKVKINEQTGHDSYAAWREKDHDDLVLSVAIGCWYGEKTKFSRTHITRAMLGL